MIRSSKKELSADKKDNAKNMHHIHMTYEKKVTQEFVCAEREKTKHPWTHHAHSSLKVWPCPWATTTGVTYDARAQVAGGGPGGGRWPGGLSGASDPPPGVAPCTGANCRRAPGGGAPGRFGVGGSARGDAPPGGGGALGGGGAPGGGASGGGGGGGGAGSATFDARCALRWTERFAGVPGTEPLPGSVVGSSTGPPSSGGGGGGGG